MIAAERSLNASESEAEKIINDMRNQVCEHLVQHCAGGVTEKEANTIRGAFGYPGFSL